jgi:hypothetical protein
LKEAEKAERKKAAAIQVAEEADKVKEAEIIKEPAAPVKQESVVEEEAEKAIVVTEQQVPAIEAPEVNEATGILAKGFYITVGSFNSQTQAEAFMKSLDKSIYFPRMGRKEANGPIHVYIDSDHNGAEAEKRLRAHKLDRNFKNAVLLEVQ